MIVHWMRVGFVHGVMNTDNMSVLGLTIDYGPYGWLEDYDPNWTPNTTDAANRRYRFGQQPAIAQWNLLKLANAIYALIGDADPLNAVLNEFAKRYTEGSQKMTAAKLGLAHYLPEHDDELCGELFGLLGDAETDMTLFFRNLARVDLDKLSIEPLNEAYYHAGATDAGVPRTPGRLAVVLCQTRPTRCAAGPCPQRPNGQHEPALCVAQLPGATGDRQGRSR